MNLKGCGRKRSCPNFKVLSQHPPGRTERNLKNCSRESRPSGHDLYTGPPEYETGVLNIQPTQKRVSSRLRYKYQNSNLYFKLHIMQLYFENSRFIVNICLVSFCVFSLSPVSHLSL